MGHMGHGDFNQAAPSATLPNVHQFVNCYTRDNKTLYTIKGVNISNYTNICVQLNTNVLTVMLRTECYILSGATYFKTIRKSTAVVMMTKLENSTAMALTEGKGKKPGLDITQLKTHHFKPSK